MGGGIWNWFDPLSLIKAMKIVNKKQSHIKLVFMGVRPPDPTLPLTSMSIQAIQLSKELNLWNQSVFFNEEWIPYEERQNFLLDADIGVSTHFEHLETKFSFRTRILDYLWAGLPILSTEGDSFAELIDRHQLGMTVPYQDEHSTAQAILSMISHPDSLYQMRQNVLHLKEKFYWPVIIEPLNHMIKRFQELPRSQQFWTDAKIFMRFLINKLKERGLEGCLNAFYRQYISK